VNRIHSTARSQLPTIVSTVGDDKKMPLPKIQQMLVQFLESMARSSSRRYDSPCTVKRCSSFSPPMYNSIRCLESRSRAPLVSERFARVSYRLSARSSVSRQGSRFCNADRPLASQREAFAIPG
jgi:hypothetical protein